jgi:sucrose-6-phosphate hydrolase SacC (GH32 family)
MLISKLCYADISIPKPEDWIDRGVILEQSEHGIDKHFSGYSPSSVVKKDNTFFLYYIGSSGPRKSDGKPKNRALCVATSKDGIHFNKFSGNPIMEYQPHNNEEEGIFSASATLDENKNIVLYYGAIWAKDEQTEEVDVFINVAISDDGVNFNNLGKVFKSRIENLNENTPLAVIYNKYQEDQEQYYLFYGRDKATALLTGNVITKLNKKREVQIDVTKKWKGIQVVSIGKNRIVLFADSNPLKVWIADFHSLNFKYYGEYKNLKPLSGLAILLDKDTQKWYLYYRSFGNTNNLSDVDRISLYIAPVRITKCLDD